ncbi:MAG TPA: prepilin peptidase [Verrucomicrobiae bacterium]|nr:prepilin peptidase [Verrucomicrobiae bacterium]
MIAAMFFLFGIIFGSFLNVCIHRFPREESIVWPGSHCPGCNGAIAWYDNIPLFSFLALRGKCRKCKAPIPMRYFWVELATGVIWMMFGMQYGLSLMTAAGIVYFTILLAITATDFETGYIPDKLTFPGMAAGLVLSAFFPGLHGQASLLRGLLHSFLGLLTGGGILLLMGMAGNLIYKKESMGGGDIKLMAMMGAFLGIKKILIAFLLGPILALPFALYAKWVKRDETIPYGPFLALAGAWLFFFGDVIWNYFFLLPS